VLRPKQKQFKVNEQKKDLNDRKRQGNRLTSTSSTTSSEGHEFSTIDGKDFSENAAKKRELPIRSKNIDMSSYLNALTNDDSKYSDRQQQSNKVGTKCIQKRCSFCEKNGENADIYLSHPLKDSLGKIVCPVLRSYVCPKCGDSGDYAHTNKYCPETQRKQKENKIKKCFNVSD
jgi:hypothetical protein